MHLLLLNFGDFFSGIFCADKVFRITTSKCTIFKNHYSQILPFVLEYRNGNMVLNMLKEL